MQLVGFPRMLLCCFSYRLVVLLLLLFLSVSYCFVRAVTESKMNNSNLYLYDIWIDKKSPLRKPLHLVLSERINAEVYELVFVISFLSFLLGVYERFRSYDVILSSTTNISFDVFNNRSLLCNSDGDSTINVSFNVSTRSRWTPTAIL